MDYGKAYLFLTRKPKTGYTNLLMATLLSLIPVVGPIVIMGYMTIVAEWLLKDEKRERYPDLSFEWFMDYLKLGLWPFVTGIIIAVIFIPFYMIIGVGAFAIGITTDEPILLVVISVVGSLLLGIFLSVIVRPMMFYSQKVQKLDFKGSLRFTRQFLKIVGGKYLITIILNTFVSMFVIVVGLLVCFVGLYPASAIVQFAYEHLFIQLYDEYLKRGGEPLPEVNLPPQLAFRGYPHGPQVPEKADHDDSEFR